MLTTQKRLELSTSAVTGRRSNQLSHWALRKYTLEGMYLQNCIQELFLRSSPIFHLSLTYPPLVMPSTD